MGWNMILASVTLKDLKTSKRVGMVYLVAENLDNGLKDAIKEFCKLNNLNVNDVRPLLISILASDNEGDKPLIISISK
jgi:methyltransferase-like protein